MPEFRIGPTCLQLTNKVFAALLPEIYHRMLSHIATSKQRMIQENEKIEISTDLLNELTGRHQYSFEREIN